MALSGIDAVSKKHYACVPRQFEKVMVDSVEFRSYRNDHIEVLDIQTFNDACVKSTSRGRIQMALSGIDAANKKHYACVPRAFQKELIDTVMDIDMVVVEFRQYRNDCIEVMDIQTFNDACAKSTSRGRIQMALSGIDAVSKKHYACVPRQFEKVMVDSVEFRQYRNDCIEELDIQAFNDACVKPTARGRIQMALCGIDYVTKKHYACVPRALEKELIHTVMDIDMVVLETELPPCRGKASLYIGGIKDGRYDACHGVGRSVTMEGPDGTPMTKIMDYAKIPHMAIGRFGQLGQFWLCICFPAMCTHDSNGLFMDYGIQNLFTDKVLVPALKSALPSCDENKASKCC